MQDGNEHPRIFISYRREDSGGWAGRVADRLTAAFGGTNVFFDVDAINPGSDFVRNLSDRENKSDVLLAVIGRDWLTVREQDGRRRIDNPDDYVRLEISSALRNKIRVIPMLVSGARMPQAHEVPQDLADLVRREAVEITDSSFHPIIDELVRILSREARHRQATKDIDEPTPQPELVAPKVSFPNRLVGFLLDHWMFSVWVLTLVVFASSPWWLWPKIPVRAQTKQVFAKPHFSAAIKTLYVITHGQSLFNDDDFCDELENNTEFVARNLEIVDDPAEADAFLEVTYNWPGYFAYELKVRKTGVVLLNHEGSLPFAGQKAVAEIVADVMSAVNRLHG